MDVFDILLLALCLLLSIYIVVPRLRNGSALEQPSSQEQADSLVAQSTDNALVSRIEKHLKSQENPLLLIFYGSQTGTAASLAKRFKRQVSSSLGQIHAFVFDIEIVQSIDVIQECAKYLGASQPVVCAFFMATYGQGVPTDSALAFVDSLDVGLRNYRKEDNANMEYMAFGLGSSAYPDFNKVIRGVDKKLRALGAKRIGSLGEGDDDKSMEQDFQSWTAQVVPLLAQTHGLAIASASNEPQHQPLFQLVPLERTKSTFKGELGTRPRPFIKTKLNRLSVKKTIVDAKHPFYTYIVQSRPLYSGSFDEFVVSKHVDVSALSSLAGVQITETSSDKRIKTPRNCYHFDLSLHESGLRYLAGDHLGIWPCNRDEEVARIAEHLSHEFTNELSLDSTVTFASIEEDEQVGFPVPCPVGAILKHYVDLSAPMKQHQMEILAFYAMDKREKDFLFLLSQDSDLFVKYIEKPQRSLADVLDECRSVKLPLAVALTEILAPINKRYYSISSSQQLVENKHIVSVTAVIVRYILVRPRFFSDESVAVLKTGLTTGFLERLHFQGQNHGQGLSSLIPIYVRKSGFNVPRNLNQKTPVLLIGPGTGIAPFRGFIQEISMLSKSTDTCVVLYTGNRHPDQDCMYPELDTQCRVERAYSRLENIKVYVQNLLLRDRDLVVDFVKHRNGVVFVCGDRHMAQDVSRVLEQMLGTEHVSRLRAKSRYHEDVW